jgi:hypothetical protein
MANVAWHAYYFASRHDSMPPVRTEIIEAENEEDAARVAKGRMERCRRVDIARPVWAPPQGRTIYAPTSSATH